MPVTARTLWLLLTMAGAAACSAPGDGDAAVANSIGGDPARGRAMLRKYGCQS